MKPVVEMQGTTVMLGIGSAEFGVVMYCPTGSTAVGIDPELLKVLHTVLRPGDTVIDGGANNGFISLIMATFVGTAGKVTAFEPEFDNIATFKHNLMLNKELEVKIAPIELVEKALWSGNYEEKQVTLHLSKKDGEHCLAGLGEYEVSIQPTLVTAIDDYGIKPRLIKLDIEGAEIEALKGATQTIRANHSYVVCEYNKWALERFGKNLHSLQTFAKEQFGYDTYVLTRFHAYPLFVPPSVEIVANIANINVLLATSEMLAAAYPKLDYNTPLSIDQHIQ